MKAAHAGILAVILGALGVATALAVKPPADSSTGSGRVFLPNPVQTLGNEDLTDQKDADYPALQPAYRTVTLTDLDGSGFLRGNWANVVSETGNPAYSSTNTFLYGRTQDEFEQVMAYYWVTESQRYIQRLGFGVPGSGLGAVNMESQDVRINQWGADNSFQTNHPKDEMRFGKGGVDDAEDAEVILHEYGHAIQDAQVPNFGSTLEAGSIGEGFGDYWAVTVSDVIAGPGALNDAPCVADWDSVSYTAGPRHCLRRVDGNKIYPRDVRGEVHADGEIWSRALWDIREAIGATRADRLILASHFGFAPDTTFRDAALATIATARWLDPGAATVARKAFADRGFLG
jgi:hypothetical protein